MIDCFKDEYFFLSNFYPCKVKYEGITYSSVEHAFQAAKTTNLFRKIEIAKAKTPDLAKKLGRQVILRPDWEVVKEKVMSDLVYIKFLTNEDIKQKLLETGEEDLVEGNYWHDNCWGNCNCEKCSTIEGKNLLGKILMEVRTKLKSE